MAAGNHVLVVGTGAIGAFYGATLARPSTELCPGELHMGLLHHLQQGVQRRHDNSLTLPARTVLPRMASTSIGRPFSNLSAMLVL